jgi:amino acid transporter
MSTNAQDKNDGGARRSDANLTGGSGGEVRPGERAAASGRRAEPETAPQTTVLGTSGGPGATGVGTNETTVLDTPGWAGSGTAAGSNDTTVLGTSAAGAGAAGAAGSGGRRQRLSAERQLDDERSYTDTSAYRPVTPLDRDTMYVNQRQAYGGVKVGSAFFGWLSAAALTVLLFSIAAGIVAAVGYNSGALPQDPRSLVSDDSALGITAIVVSLVLLFIAYFGGGYVAGRMARFDGLRQGLAVWVWAIVMAVLATVIGLATGGMDLVNTVTGSAALSSMVQDLSVPGLITLGVVLLVTLAGALLGGLAGMRFHRKVDRAGFETQEEY